MIKDDTVKSRPAGMWSAAAAIDAKERTSAAYDTHQEFFDNPAYAARVDTARKIISDFFEVKDMYENCRANRGRPFTVIKVTNHIFPRVSIAEKAKRYRDPLEAIDTEIKFASGTNSYLYYIR